MASKREASDSDEALRAKKAKTENPNAFPEESEDESVLPKSEDDEDLLQEENEEDFLLEEASDAEEEASDAEEAVSDDEYFLQEENEEDFFQEEASDAEEEASDAEEAASDAEEAASDAEEAASDAEENPVIPLDAANQGGIGTGQALVDYWFRLFGDRVSKNISEMSETYSTQKFTMSAAASQHSNESWEARNYIIVRSINSITEKVENWKKLGAVELLPTELSVRLNKYFNEICAEYEPSFAEEEEHIRTQLGKQDEFFLKHLSNEIEVSEESRKRLNALMSKRTDMLNRRIGELEKFLVELSTKYIELYCRSIPPTDETGAMQFFHEETSQLFGLQSKIKKYFKLLPFCIHNLLNNQVLLKAVPDSEKKEVFESFYSENENLFRKYGDLLRAINHEITKELNSNQTELAASGR